MTPPIHRGFVIVLVTALCFSVIVGAAMPAVVAGSSPSGDNAVLQYSLNLGGTVGDTVDTVTGDDEESIETSESTTEPTANESIPEETPDESITGIVDETTGGLQETVDDAVRTPEPTETPTPKSTETPAPTETSTPELTETPTPTPTKTATPKPTPSQASTRTPTLSPEPTPDKGSVGSRVGDLVGATVETVTGQSTPERTPTATEDAAGDSVDSEVESVTSESETDDSGNETVDSENESGSGNLIETTTTVVGEVGTGTTKTVEEIVTGTTDVVRETTNATGETVENTTSTTGGAVDRTVRTATGGESRTAETVDGVTDLTNETVGTTTRTADGAVRTVENTTDEVVNATAETGISAGSPGELVGSTVGGVTRTVDATVTGTVDGTSTVTTTVDETVSLTTGLFDDGNGSVARLAENVTDTVDTVTGGLTATVDNTTRTVQRTTDALTDGVDTTGEGTGRIVDGIVAPGVTGPVFDPIDRPTGDTKAYGSTTEDSQGSNAGGSDGSAQSATTSVSADGSEEPVPFAAPGATNSEGDNATSGTGDSEGGESETDGATSSSEGVLPPLDQVEPAAGGAIVGAVLVSGSVLATRAGMTASSMGAGAASLPQLLFAMLKELALRLAVLAGYSRYDFSNPLENDNRATVLETVEATPGINLTSLVEETGLAESTVRYHLRVLEHEGLLEAAKVRGRRRFVPRTDEDVELVAAFEEEATRDVIDALFEHEPATGTTLAEALDRDPSTVSHHLSRLSEAGLVEREQDGPALRNSLTADVRAALSDVEIGSSVQQHVQADD